MNFDPTRTATKFHNLVQKKKSPGASLERESRVADQVSQLETLESKNWQEAGGLATSNVSSTYCRMLTLRNELEY